MILKQGGRDTSASLKSEKVYKNIFTILIMVQQPAAAQSAQPQQPAAAQPAPAAQPAQAVQTGQPEKKKSKWLIWTIAILAAIAVGVAIGFFI